MKKQIRSLAFLTLSLAATAAYAGYDFVTIDAPGAQRTFLLDINNGGNFTGYTSNDSPVSPVGYTTDAFTGHYDGTGFGYISRPGTFSNGASGINSNGDISGVSIFLDPVAGTFTGKGFMRTAGGTFTDIDPSQGGITSAYSEAVDLNDNGSAVGFFMATQPTLDEISTGSSSHGFVLKNGVYSQVDHAGGFGTQLYSVNNAGTASGRYLDALGNSHGFLYDTNTSAFTDYTIPGFDSVELGGLNSNGDFIAIGYQPSPFGVIPMSFLHTSTGFTPFAMPGALATVAYGLNDSGQVVGLYVAPDFTYHGFTATPQAVPEPATFAALGLGAVALLRKRKRA